jgi:hypothetical protein
LQLYETPQGTTGPANADAQISADSAVSSQISLLDQHGSEVLLGETLMVPVADSMVYIRPMYVSPTTNAQPQLTDVIAVLGKKVKIDTSLSSVLTDLLQTSVSLPSGSGGPTTGTVPAAVSSYLSAAQTDYTNALAALKAGNLAGFQSDIQSMQQAITSAQQSLGAPSSASITTTTTTTLPKAGKASTKKTTGTTSSTITTTPSSSSTSSSTTTVPASTEPKGGATTTSTSIASAAAAPG